MGFFIFDFFRGFFGIMILLFFIAQCSSCDFDKTTNKTIEWIME